MPKPPSLPETPRRPDGTPAEPAAQNPLTQICQKCGAMFRWERTNKDDPKSPLALKLIEPSRKCDCGYGKARRR